MIDNNTIFSILRKTKHWIDGNKEAFNNSPLYHDWAAVLSLVRRRLEKLKSTSLCGLNDNCLSIVPFDDVLNAANKPQLSYYVWLRLHNPPIVYSLSSTQKPTIFHIGAGVDREDLKFKKYRPGDLLPIPLEKLNKDDEVTHPIINNHVIRIDCRPKDTGGPGHYFFYKLPRDLRVCGDLHLHDKS